MAHIDNLIDSVKDEKLRAAIRSEYDRVTKHRKLGLVFDRHLPESVVLPTLSIHSGDKVQVMATPADGASETAINQPDRPNPNILDGTGVWTFQRKSNTGDAILVDGEGNAKEVPFPAIVATREFGDPIYPGLKSTGRVVRGGGTIGDDGGKPFHTIINAENYHALEALLFPCQGKVDAIYIDPPYNTRDKDWKYNNDYVDKVDPYKHSKWLSFMEKRLLLAKKLLNPVNSVLIVTIDENEYPRLLLLLEQIFPDAAITSVSVAINPKGTPENGFGRVDEYVIFVAFGGATPTAVFDPMYGPEPEPEAVSVRWRGLTRTGANGVRAKSPGAYYPIFINRQHGNIEGAGVVPPPESDGSEVIPPPGTVAVWPTPRPNGTLGRWSVVRDTFEELLKIGAVRVGRINFDRNEFPLYYLTDSQLAKLRSGEIVETGRDKSGALIVEWADASNKKAAPRTIWSRASHSASEHGTGLLAKFIPGVAFDFAKSLYAVEDTLRLFLQNKPEALVVDFFAGSGTTTHAVMRLNHQDGGRRRSISVTNNEVSADEANGLSAQGYRPGDPEWETLGICEYITKPRIAAAVTGLTPIGRPIAGDYKFPDDFPMSEGFAENVEFFTLTYEDPTLVSLGRNFAAIAPLIWLKAGAIGERIDQIDPKGWALPAKASYGILFDADAWPAFVQAVNERVHSRGTLSDAQPESDRELPLTHVFVVTDSIVEYQAIVSKLDPALITTRLYADYLRTFEINTH